MRYLPVKEERALLRRRHVRRVISIAFIVVFFFARERISSVLVPIAAPFWSWGSVTGERVSGWGETWRDALSLAGEKRALEARVVELERKLSLAGEVQEENTSLRSLLGRPLPASGAILARVLVRPPRSAYDTLVIDAGTAEGVPPAGKAFVGGALLGEVSDLFPHMAKIELYSSPGKTFDIILGEEPVAALAKGMGGGMFLITFPKGVEIQKGAPVRLSNSRASLLARVVAVEDDTNIFFQRIIAEVPFNIQTLQWIDIRP